MLKTVAAADKVGHNSGAAAAGTSENSMDHEGAEHQDKEDMEDNYQDTEEEDYVGNEEEDSVDMAGRMEYWLVLEEVEDTIR